MDDLISRQAAIDIERNATVDTNPSHFEAHQKFTQFMDDAEISSFGRWQWSNGFNTALTAVGIDLKKLPPAQPDPDMIHLQKEQAYMQGYEDGQKTQYTWDTKELSTTQPDKIEVHLQEPHALMIKELIVKETTYSMGTKQETVGELIRCKDCMYWVSHDKRCVYLNHGFAPNMWCCHAERRTDE